MTEKALRSISLYQELELGVETTKSALSLIQAIEPDRTPIFLIFLVLSTGLERIFKVLLGLRMLTDQGRFLSENELRTYGHDLCKLKSDVLSQCFDEQKLNTQIEHEDYDFVSNDVLLNKLLEHLSEFAKKDRYVYMSRIADENATGKWLSHRWEEIESAIIPTDVAVESVVQGRQKQYKEEISTRLVICVERLLGALVRTITLGGMNGQANSAGTLLHDFLSIRDSELGKKKYELFGFTPV